ncbi:hypothetical protein A3D81_01135 [Candidatus Curtissbacteria bacterium RIFCSPHIGHO2_02_FULL_40_17]|uniref:N-acetyltransferase domain-containing protein n=4 Tax=Candidatus Curtissiibacteriota TaxID=1752717 RepID=A0A1F5GHP7_9BACT|nr:MAG: hypothetical protein A2693_02695 [Candidatus Curtissbacteria bacterium RIFCSPHIGHO2_01_FULL_40_12]OGD91386.1 MAG: hypothetical protein A3D81_01135 [Candidatus Curtissbacteria bacterium RIFCSPHIGHO2_02_FULL_40_17]OGE04042.1 MAG: hypothetical protein A3F45_02820 [Candidatus Curtissbacteria bacterium RIFCSPHIGHO2_12_FULL_41_17]OGE08596.1 MAG: hypothetical protein A3I53_02390 [Candidatus Curtissbacteria bacterium RIFCSPLOWO2_02_FULL_40_13b]
MRNPFLAGKNIYLRPLEEKDLQGNYVSWLNNEEVSRYNSHNTFPYSYSEGRKYIKQSSKTKDKIVLAIVLTGKNLHIGNIALQNIDPVNRSGELTILLGEKDYWHKGYSKEAALLILKHGFDELNLNRIYCGTSSKNIAMQKLAVSLGMIEEGRRRKAFFKDREYADIVEYGILSSEFDAPKRK